MSLESGRCVTPHVAKPPFLLCLSFLMAHARMAYRAANPSHSECDTLRAGHDVAAAPVLRSDLLKSPIKIASIELLRQDQVLLVRARSTDGAESVTVPNVTRLLYVFPLFLKQVVPWIASF
jgi:hypothetical protein